MATAQSVIPDRSSLNETLSGNVINNSAPLPEDDLLAEAEAYDYEDPAQEAGSGILESLPFLIFGVIVSIAVLVVLLTLEARRASGQAEYVERASRLQALSQDVAINASHATSGDDRAFEALQQAKQAFTSITGSLEHGDEQRNLKALPGVQKSLLAPVAASWAKIQINVDTIFKFRESLSNTREQVGVVNELAPLLLVRWDELVDAVISESGDVYAVNEAARQRGLSQRIVKDVNIYAKGEVDAAAAAAQIGRDLAEFQTAYARLRRTGGPVIQARLENADKVFSDMLASITSLFKDAPGFFEAQNASLAVREAADELRPVLHDLPRVISDARPGGLTAYLPWAVAALVVVFLLLLGRALIGEARTRAELSASQNRDTQDAILKLLDEMGSLADGDLAIEAETTDQITGTIADSVNFAVKEMRDLVVRIKDASQQIASESQSTSATAQALLVASAKQATQITNTAGRVQSMSTSMEDMSTEALRSADAAKNSMEVAKRGAKAVRGTIRGMDGMRAQIQETSKRIKRLGESSQQISDIVGLIDDIAEQTNILSLNAAIQAAVAGEAGKGFAVVADEVQRLAERSAEATQQINNLVRNIQSDTNEAVISMEYATQGVVDGTRIADAAGQALNEIENASERMSGLIGKMAENAHEQSESAVEVSTQMTYIRDITRNTEQNAKHTAESIGKLTSLAKDLEQSVAGFRIPG